MSTHQPDFTLRLATNDDDLFAAQRLRYDVFYREMGAQPTSGSAEAGLDEDVFDDFCDHLLVVEKSDAGSDTMLPIHNH